MGAHRRGEGLGHLSPLPVKSSTTTIVPAALEHLDRYRACLDAVAREGRWLALGQAPSIEQTRAFMANILAGNGVQVFAVDGDRVLGWADIVRPPHAATRHAGELGMGVLKSHRGQGLGRALIERALADAWALGLRRMALDVRVDNHAALALYASVGFVHEGTRRASHCQDGCYHDAHVMGLLRQD